MSLINTGRRHPASSRLGAAAPSPGRGRDAALTGRRDEITHFHCVWPCCSCFTWIILPFPLLCVVPLLVRRGSHIPTYRRQKVETGWEHVHLCRRFDFFLHMTKSQEQTDFVDKSIYTESKTLKIGKEAYFKCLSNSLCVFVLLRGRTKKEYQHSNFLKKLPQNRDWAGHSHNSSKRQPVTVSISNALRKWLVIPLMLLYNFWVFTIFPFLFIVANFDPTWLETCLCVTEEASDSGFAWIFTLLFLEPVVSGCYFVCLVSFIKSVLKDL